MLMESDIYRNDIYNIVSDTTLPWESYRNKSILITGATGLIGSTLVNTFMVANEQLELNCKLYLIVRNINKAVKLFGDTVENVCTIFTSSVEEFTSCTDKIDYIIHTASCTSSKAFVERPVETFLTNIIGTKNLLEIASSQDIESMVYLSTMEVYGTPMTDEKITEDISSSLKSSDVRNSYPVSKVACENLCRCYSAEYDVPTTILRLTQTFGPGVDYNDGRVFAEFARDVIEQRDIVLKTKGETKRNYLYTADAVKSVLIALIKAEKNGDIYNVANEETYCTISEMANLVVDLDADKKISVKYEIQDINVNGYAPTLHMNLDCNKLKKIGWFPNVGLQQMYQRMIADMKSYEVHCRGNK